MLYAIISQDTEGSLDRRLAARNAHLDRLNKLAEQERLILAGPHPAVDSEEPGPAGYTGSLIVAKFENWDEAIKWAEEDPYISAGVYENVIVKPFKHVLP